MSRPFERAATLSALGLEHALAMQRGAEAVEGLHTARQVHGKRVLRAPPLPAGAECDALISTTRGTAVGVWTADCVPVLLAHGDGRGVAAVHAGWRGTAAGICDEAVRALCSELACATSALVAVIGPHIGPCCYEVDRPVFDAFADRAAFSAGARADHWQLDLGLANRRQLVAAGLPDASIERVGGCTACTPGAYPSFRRDGTGRRMLHWIRVPAD